MNNSHDENNYLAYTRNISIIAKKVFTFRPMAYASEVGESGRPLLNKNIIRFAYGLSWTYVFADTGFKTYEVKHLGPNAMKWKAFDTGIWHTFASMLLPAATIHTIVKYSSIGLNHVIKNNTQFVRFGRFAPSIIGLISIPFIIHPIDHAVDMAMDYGLRPYYFKYFEENIEK